MEARLSRLLVLLLAPALMGASYRTQNFVVTAPTPEIAKQVGDAAEHYRKQLAIEWLGQELRRWSAPCPVRVNVGQIGAGGQTTFSFFANSQGSAEVCNWDMQIQGSLERILDSVLPHEISHTIFACHFRRPLPRWADEGAATLAEHDSEKRRQVHTVRQVLGTRRWIPLRNLMNIKEYPRDMQDVLTLYAEGYSLAELLVQERGREQYLKFISDAHQQGWDRAVQIHYGYRGVDDLEKHWNDWVIAGSPEVDLPKGQALAHVEKEKKSLASGEVIVRGQSPAEDPFITDQVVAMVEPPRSPGGNSLAAPAPRERPMRREQKIPANRRENDERRAGSEEPGREQKKSPVAAAPKANIYVSDETRREGPESDEEAGELPMKSQPRSSNSNPSRALPRKQSGKTQVAEARTSAARRQVTEWSEFPQDQRPSPLILPARNRSGSRP